MISLTSPQFEKLYIQPYRDAAFTEMVPEKRFTALINPASYKSSYSFEYDKTQAPGTSSAELRFTRIKPQTFNFDFVFDGTGVVKDMSVLSLGFADPFGKSVSVTDQIDTFRQQIIQFQGSEHRPYYLKIHWGTLLFRGVLVKMDIEYKVFAPDGAPIRAIAKCEFTGSIEDNLRKALENKQSPDITHERLFAETDRLDRLAEKIYDSKNFHVQVADFNDLDGFRKIAPSTKLYFPPLSK